MLKLGASCGFDILCLFVFCGVKWYRFSRRKRDKYILYRESVFAFIVFISLIDITYALVAF